MSQVYLINQATFAGFEDISMNVKPARINAFVKKAQDLDLKPFFGHTFYYDFIQWFSNDESGALVIDPEAPQVITDLFEGADYEDTHGHNIVYEGLIPTMVYFTFARFIEADSIHYTTTGPVYKQHDSSEPLSDKAIARIVAQQRSVANAHANEVQKFLWDNKSNYPLWRFNERNKNSRQPGARIRGIDRTSFNRAGYGYGYDNGLLGLNDIL